MAQAGASPLGGGSCVFRESESLCNWNSQADITLSEPPGHCNARAHSHFWSSSSTSSISFLHHIIHTHLPARQIPFVGYSSHVATLFFSASILYQQDERSRHQHGALPRLRPLLWRDGK